MTDRLVTLAGDRDLWERQDGESVRQHARFMVYRDLGRGRTLGRVQAACAADGDQVAAGTLRNTSSAHRWAERAEMWDRHRDDLHARVWLDARREAAERDAQLLSMAVEHLARRIQTLDLDEASISEVTHLLNTVLRHRRILYGDPSETVAITGSGGDPITVKLAEFAAMPPDGRRQAITDLATGVLRMQQAIDGVDDDD